jgi:hypothetical protein
MDGLIMEDDEQEVNDKENHLTTKRMKIAARHSFLRITS